MAIPEERVVNEELKRCITEDECDATPQIGSYFTFNKTCVSKCPRGHERVSKEEGNCHFCGEDCVVYCAGMTVNSMSSAQKMSGCTHVTGSLEIRINRPETVPELIQHLGSIRFIQHSLTIARSNAITSLGFLQSLQTINGSNLERSSYALFVFENQNLKRLWNFTNFKLTIKNGSVAFHNNPLLCLSDIYTLVNLTNVKNESVSTYSNGHEALCDVTPIKIQVTPNCTNVTVTWDEPYLNKARNETLIGYTIFYTQYFEKSFDRLDSQTVCGSNTWESYFVSNNSYFITNLEPYTQYACYIKSMTTLSTNQSNISYFETLSDDPEKIPFLNANATSPYSINLTWIPPYKTNGELAFFMISIDLIEDDPGFVFQRNYCLHPPDFTTTATEVDNVTESKCCQDSVKAKVELWTHGLLAFCYVQHHRMQTWDNKLCYRSIYHTENKPTIDEFDVLNLVATTRKPPDVYLGDPTATSYEVSGLTHFTMFAFFITACNVNRTAKPQCGPFQSAYARTLQLESADYITNVTLKKIIGSSVQLTWQDPKEPNAMIVAYNIEYKRSDIKHSQSIVECVTRNDFLFNNSVYTIHKLLPGKYKVRVQATSLATRGKYSSYLGFELHDESSNYQSMPIIFTILLIMAGATAVIYYFWYKRKLSLQNIYLVASVNPDYEGGVYITDEWEIDRDDLEITETEIGHGTFGKVFAGVIKSRNMPCAIKTVNDTATQSMRMEFLKEASVMKGFKNAHHLIKLLGVVSRSQPPLVVMELMDRGDLKTYLRRARNSSSGNITTNETYKMAAEIADGMAYLAALKVVHRDLAARNCMIAYDRTIKVGDFGMARDIYENDYYRKESTGLLPVRWMAPESLADGVFTTDTDVWSYGIVLWEIATFAEQPYQGLSNEQVLRHVISRGRLERPEECSDLLYEIMSSCWRWRPIDRLQFMDIVEILTPHIGETFRLVSYCHTNEARNHRINAGVRTVNQPALGHAASESSDDSYRAYEDNVDLYFGDGRLLPHGSQRRHRSKVVPSASSTLRYPPSPRDGRHRSKLVPSASSTLRYPPSPPDDY